MDISLPWGADELKLSLPDNWTIQQIAQPQVRTSSDNWKERLARAISQPDSGLSLDKLLSARKQGKIVIVIEDVTRHSPVAEILKVLLAELDHCQVDPSQVEFIFATGMHPAMTPDQAREKLGDAAEKYRWRSNPWHDKRAYINIPLADGTKLQVDRGLADADLRIVVSSVSPHLQAGFGGGYKMFFPGCATRDTIRWLHRHGLSRTPRQLVGLGGDQNPMRHAIDLAGSAVDARHGVSFFIQYLLGEDDQPTFIAAGEPMPTQQMAAKQCAVECGVVLNAPADVAIVDAHPRDFDLWQSFKCIANIRWALRPGGLIMCFTRCPGGMNNVKPPPWPLSPSATRRVVKFLGAETISSLLVRTVPSLAGDAAFFVRMAAQTIHRNPVFMISPSLHASGGSFPAVELFGDPVAAIRAADEYFKHRQVRAVVFPWGGITYPICRDPVQDSQG